MRTSTTPQFLGHPDAKFFERQPWEAKTARKEKGDISIEVRKGTFLKSFDKGGLDC
jgi:hypothetical protein